MGKNLTIVLSNKDRKLLKQWLDIPAVRNIEATCRLTAIPKQKTVKAMVIFGS